MDTGRITPQESITPDFEKRKDGTKIGSSQDGARDKAAEKLRKNEKETLEGNGGSGASGGFYKGGASGNEIRYRQSDVKKRTGKVMGKIKKLAPLMTGLVVVLVLMVSLRLLPTLAIGAIKENLIRSLGFEDTTAILEKQSEYVVSEKMAKGKMPSKLAADFLAQGIEVGQVTMAGEFVRTNDYIAELGSPVAAEGEYVANGEGELALRFRGEIITADDFVAKVESDPVLYAAFSEGLDISARYYYSDTVNGVYNNMGLSRGAFNDWDATGNAEADQKSFKEVLDKTLDKESNRNMSGQYWEWRMSCQVYDDITGELVSWCWEADTVKWQCNGGGSAWTCAKTINDAPAGTESFTGEPSEVAAKVVNYVEANTRHDTDIENAFSSGGPIKTSPEENTAQTLNTVLSADEPYRAASDFLSLMEALERAQIVGDGPVNEMMNILSQPKEVTYVDVNTGQTVTNKTSVLDTYNFQMAVGNNKDYSISEASNLSRDRILKVSNTTSKTSIEDMPLSTDGKKKSGDGLEMQNNYYDCSPNSEECPLNNIAASISGKNVVTDAMRIGMAEKNSELFATSLGANRILEGGSFISNTINQQVIGAMPSDEAQVALYKRDVHEVLARQAEADRATKSPFDVSSPNTFMGSLARKMAVALLHNYTTTNNSLFVKTASTVGKLASNSIKNLTVGVMADGNDGEFTTANGECSVVSTTDATCNLYGSSHNTVYTGHMDWREEDWAGAVSEEEVDNFTKRAMKRDATVGIESYDVCEVVKNPGTETESSSGFAGKIKGILKKITAFIKKVVAVVTNASTLDAGCMGVDKDIATGSKYVLHGGDDDDTAKLSGFMLYSVVSSLLEDDEDTATE